MLLSGLQSQSLAQEFRASGQIEWLAYPQQRAGHGDNAVRGYFTFETEQTFDLGFGIETEATIYIPPGSGAAYVDGRLELEAQIGMARVKAGLLREQWGITRQSRLNVLTDANRILGLTSDPEPISQPGASLTFPVGDTGRLQVVALAGHRASPIPDPTDRLSFGVNSAVRRNGGSLGNGALAARLSGNAAGIDWAVHVFHGLSRRPTYVFGAGPTVTAVYDEITQAGFALETTIGAWRLWGEGFWRQDGRDALGGRTDYGHVAAAAEYQYFAAFDGKLDLIAELRVTQDTRGALADQPFQNGISAGLRGITTSALPWSAEVVYLRDRRSGGSGVQFNLEKQLSESPYFKGGLYFEKFQAGKTVDVLGVLQDDFNVSLAVNWEF